MKQLSTKSVGSLLSALAYTVGGAGRRASDRHLERILQRHDRKCELRASLLGMTPLEFRDALRRHAYDDILRLHGFKNREAFNMALRGKLIAELLHRGWSRHRIDTYIERHRLASI